MTANSEKNPPAMPGKRGDLRAGGKAIRRDPNYLEGTGRRGLSGTYAPTIEEFLASGEELWEVDIAKTVAEATGKRDVSTEPAVAFKRLLAGFNYAADRFNERLEAEGSSVRIKVVQRGGTELFLKRIDITEPKPTRRGGASKRASKQ